MQLIGKKLKVVKSSNKSLEGKEGKVVDETKNMIIIENENRISKVLKRGIIVEVTSQDVPVTIHGDELIGTQEERLKKKEKVKIRW